MSPSAELNEVFSQNFESVEVAKPPFRVALCGGVDEKAAKAKLQECSPEINVDEAIVSANGLSDSDFLKKLADGEYGKVYAILGRTNLDTAIKGLMSADPEFLKKLKQNCSANFIGKLGNGVGFDTQAVFEEGITAVRTPRANAETVTIWTNLLLDAMEAKDPMDPTFLATNPAAKDNKLVKEGGDPSKKIAWDRSEISGTANPHLISNNNPALFDEKMNGIAEAWKGKRIAVIGVGKIGEMVMGTNPRFPFANVVYYDKNPNIKIPGAVQAKTMEDALRGADLVLMHADGEKPLMNAREIELLKDGAMIVNTARGGVINPKDLLAAIESGKISKLGADVHADEKNLKKAIEEFTVEGVFSLDNIPREQWEDRHYAVALRMHQNVIASNHSAANEKTGKKTNAEDGISAAFANWKNGDVVNGFKAAPDVQFPYKGFIQDGEEGPERKQYEGERFAIEIAHDGKVAGILKKAHEKIEQILKACELIPENGSLDMISDDLVSRNMPDGKVNAFAFQVLGVNAKAKLTPAVLEAIRDTIERVFDAIYGVRIWQVSEKQQANDA
ncbi:MAG: NAD(P)-dependent oxidoreductase [Candidatus Gracilibacteria bacterium]|jgi:lactate dehydrogenase-like 2-hydroxyacid dehydrogenase